MTRPTYPDGKRFAFTIFDDADDATVANSAPVYRLLADLGFRTTKSVWVYPPRGSFVGECLLDEPYRDWVLGLEADGFEIGLHNVGDGEFSRAEILAGLDRFREVIGYYPRSHTNHVSNPDCIYWWDRRFDWPFNLVYRLAYRVRHGRRTPDAGNDPASSHFWGDACKQHIRYIRNLTFNAIDTLAHDPRMPYEVRSKQSYSNLWFSSSDGQRIEEMRDLLSDEHLDELETHGGACIVYTHFASGFVDDAGRVDSTFARQMERLAAMDGWFVPVSTLLDHLAEGRTTDDPGYRYRLGLNVRWGVDRLGKRLRYHR